MSENEQERVELYSDDNVRTDRETDDISLNFFSDAKAKKYIADHGLPSRGVLHMVVGARGCGKTFFPTYKAIRLWTEERKKTVWVRNKKEEFKGTFRATFLNDMVSHGIINPEDPWNVQEDGVYYGDNIVILFMSISTFGNSRGGAHPDVEFYFFDEFIPEDLRYPPNAGRALASMMNTIFRGRDIYVLAAANKVSSINPYFSFCKLFPERGKDIVHRTDGRGRFTILIETARGYKVASDQESPLSGFNEMVDYGYDPDSIDPLDDLITGKVKGAWSGWAVVTRDTIYGIVHKKGLYHFQPVDKLPTEVTLYTWDTKCVSNNVRFKSATNQKSLDLLLEGAKMRFDCPKTAWDILSLCRGGF